MSNHGDTTVVQRDHLGYPTALARRHPWLSIHEPDVAQARSVRIEGEAVLGSAPDATVQIADRTVSRMHAQIELRDDGAWIRDLSSSNGLFVDDVRVEAARLHDGASLTVGQTRLRVEYEREPSTVRLWPVDEFGPLLGRSVAMREVFHHLDRAARSDATALILGETGTGKELAAQAIHEASHRGSAPMSVIDCGALSSTLLDSEIFGHAKGAFTGAESDRAGAVEAAAGGSVFLDEVGELPLEMQPKLLRLLESKQVRRIGENEHREVDVRFIAATHCDLRSMVNEGSFREDLYFRLAVISVRLPPLRQRTDDLPMLIERLVPEGQTLELGPEELADLARRPWRGNIRALRNWVHRRTYLGEDIPQVGPSEAGPSMLPGVRLDRPFSHIRTEWIDHLERTYLAGQIERCGGNVSEAARAAGLNRSYFYRLMSKHKLS